MGTPQNTAQEPARVAVTVIRNRPPVFLNTDNYFVGIQMTSSGVIFRTNYTDPDDRVSLFSFQPFQLQIVLSQGQQPMPFSMINYRKNYPDRSTIMFVNFGEKVACTKYIHKRKVFSHVNDLKLCRIFKLVKYLLLN